MMPHFSLKRTYQIYGLIFLAVTLVINCFIPLCMMCTGMFSMHDITLHNAGQAAEQILVDGRQSWASDNIRVYTTWDLVPADIRALNQNIPPNRESAIRYAHLDGAFIDALSVHYTAAGRPLYLWLHYNATHDLVFAPKNMTAILLLILMTFGLVASLALHMQKKVIYPVRHISQAIKQHDWLGGQGFSLPKQGYAELQAIVDALNQSLQQLQQAQQRELDFLRYASHELRTPVAICLSSFELLALQYGGLAGPMLAASQASEQMKSIIETLLWLTNKTSTDSKPTSVVLLPLLHELAAQQELAMAKSGKINIAGDNTCCQLLADPTRIMLNNLIRNALEHGCGSVDICQQGKCIKISNRILCQDHAGFGLGLILVSRLAEQLGWYFSTERQNNQFIAILKLEVGRNFSC